jgi:hypothetical protein
MFFSNVPTKHHTNLSTGPQYHDTTEGATRGIIPRMFEHLFSRISANQSNVSSYLHSSNTCLSNHMLLYCSLICIQPQSHTGLQYECSISYLEIYNERLFDLLDSANVNLVLREDASMGMHVQDITQTKVNSLKAAMDVWMHNTWIFEWC